MAINIHHTPEVYYVTDSSDKFLNLYDLGVLSEASRWDGDWIFIRVFDRHTAVQ